MHLLNFKFQVCFCLSYVEKTTNILTTIVLIIKLFNLCIPFNNLTAFKRSIHFTKCDKYVQYVHIQLIIIFNIYYNLAIHSREAISANLNRLEFSFKINIFTCCTYINIGEIRHIMPPESQRTILREAYVCLLNGHYII